MASVEGDGKRWYQRTETAVALGFLVVIVGGIVTAFVAWMTDEDLAASNAWVTVALAAGGGLFVRWGYRLGMNARQQKIEQQVEAIYNAIEDMRDAALRDDNVVRPFPRQRDQR